MMITIEQAARILAQGDYVLIETTDHYAALVPRKMEQAEMTASDAINSLYYIVKGESTQKVLSMVKRMGRYREIRGVG